MNRAVSDNGEGDDYMGRAFLPLSVSWAIIMITKMITHTVCVWIAKYACLLKFKSSSVLAYGYTICTSEKWCNIILNIMPKKTLTYKIAE